MIIMRTLLLTLTIVSLVVTSANSCRSLHEYCLDLRRMMASNRNVYTNPEEALSEAKKHLKSIANLGKPSRAKLATAWEVVVRDKRCSSRSASYVSIIADCTPDKRDEMGTLYEAVKKYSKKCLTPKFWAERLENLLGPDDKSGLSSFLNQAFFAQYRKDNDRERTIPKALLGNEDCCKPHRSHNALTKVLAPIFGAKEGENFEKVVRRNRHKLEATLQRYLFKPCANYLEMVRKLMNQVTDAADYYEGNKMDYIQSQTQTFKDAIFRYKYCQNFATLNGSKAKLDEINASFF